MTGGSSVPAPTPPALSSLPLPKAVARSFITVSPKPHPTMDFFASFAPGSTPETFTTIPCGVQGGNCFATFRQTSATWDETFIDVEQGPTANTGLYSIGQVLGELWLTYADDGADTNGKFRMTAKQKATMNTSSFLHVTMEVNSYSTGRRYPQILISDQDVPVQYNLPSGHTIVVQPRGDVNEVYDWPVEYQVEICNLRTWDVNNQCPLYDLYHVLDSSGKITRLQPNAEVGEHANADHRITYDVYVSTGRIYLYLDNAPYACANLPSVGAPPAGPVTVTFGDALYHSAVDHTYAFHTAHQQIETQRHYDNLGFSSGVPAPAWDETRLPCAAPITP
jgi:hypothetical protein